MQNKWKIAFLSAAFMALSSWSLQAAEYEDGTLSDVGKHGFVGNGVPELNSSTPSFLYGHDGGFADESIFAITNSVIFERVDTRGGDGFNAVQRDAISFESSNMNFIGGNGGRSIAISKSASAHASGGNGASFSHPDTWWYGGITVEGGNGGEGTLIRVPISNQVTVAGGNFIGGTVSINSLSNSRITIGGEGLFVGSQSNSNSVLILSGGTIPATNGYATTTGSGVYSTLGISQRNNQTAFDSANSGILRAVGGLPLSWPLSSTNYVHSDYESLNTIVEFDPNSPEYIAGYPFIPRPTPTNYINYAIKDGSFAGGDGGNAESQNYAEANGGDGLSLTMFDSYTIASINLSNVVAIGGNGGIATGVNFARAKGGTGARISPIDLDSGYYWFPNGFSKLSSVVISDSTFIGGNGGASASDNYSSEYVVSLLDPSAGGTGLMLFGDTSLEHFSSLQLNNVTAIGGRGGNNGLGKWYGYSFVESGGTGARIRSFDEVTINGGLFKGGDVATNNHLRAGRGLVLDAERLTVNGGEFVGGEGIIQQYVPIPVRDDIIADLFTTKTTRNTGLSFSGDSLKIYDGQFNAGFNGAYDEAGLQANVNDVIALYGGEYNAIDIMGTYETNRYTEMFISRRANISSGRAAFRGHVRLWDNSDTLQDIDVRGSVLLSGNMSGSNLTVQSYGEVHVDGVRASFDVVDVNYGSRLALSSATNYLHVAVDPFPMIPHPGELLATTIRLSEDSELDLYPYANNEIAPGETINLISVSSSNLLFVTSTNELQLTEKELYQIMDPVDEDYDTYLTDVETTVVTGKEIRVTGTGLSLAEKADNPLPVELAKRLDDWRARGKDYNASFEALLNMVESPSARAELKRQFTQAAAHSAVSAVLAGQRSQNGQILAHINAARQSTGLAARKPSADAGAAGPISSKKGWNGWFKGYHVDAEKEADEGFLAYDAAINGAAIGVETIGENSMIGVSIGQAQSDIDSKEPATTDIDNFYGTIYGSIGTEKWFIDTTLAYGQSSITSSRGSPLTRAEYDANTLAGYIGLGYQAQLSEMLSVTPEIAARASRYAQDAYTETGIPGNSYEDYTHWSYQSILGATLVSMFDVSEKISIEPSVSLYWQHEFNTDEGEIEFNTNIEGVDLSLPSIVQAPEEDTFTAGIGLKTRLSERLEIDLEAKQQLAEKWKSTTYSGSLKVLF